MKKRFVLRRNAEFMRCLPFQKKRITGIGIFLLVILTLSCKTPLQEQPQESLLRDPGNRLATAQAQRILQFLAFTRKTYGIDYRIDILQWISDVSLLEYAQRQFTEQKIGAQTGGKGVLLALVLDPAQVRVEVGYALEPYITDLEASQITWDYFLPFYRDGKIPEGLEVTAEMLLNTIKDKKADYEGQAAMQGSGGGGHSLSLLEALPEQLGAEDVQRLKGIMLPQETPEKAYRLELSMLKRGIYRYDLEIFDATWHEREGKRRYSPAALKRSGNLFDQPFQVLEKDPYAVIYHPKHRNLGPSFLRRTPKGWILDRSETARIIHYNLDSTGWFAYDLASPYLALLREAFELSPVKLTGGKQAWEIKP